MLDTTPLHSAQIEKNEEIINRVTIANGAATKLAMASKTQENVGEGSDKRHRDPRAL